MLKSKDAVAASISALAYNSSDEFVVETTPEHSLSAFCGNAVIFIYTIPGVLHHQEYQE